MDSAISKVVDTLTPSFLQSLGFLFGGVEGEARKLKSTLSEIQAVLEDAEKRQIKEELVRLWLRELKDAAYDAEDIVDEVEYQVLRSKIEGEQMQTRKGKLTDRVSHLFSSSVSNVNLGPRIKEIRERLEEIKSRSNHLNLNMIYKSEMLVPGKRHPTSFIIDESDVFGRKADREKVVGLLTSDGDSSAAKSRIQVVPICGMGGLGKTTLAQQAYNDEQVKKHFGVKAWVYVSEDFNLTRLANAIVKSVTGSDPHLTDLDPFQVSIQNALQEKKFLLVLDDVWNENYSDWDALRAPLMVGARGSRILVTTRSRSVSSFMGTVPTYFLQGLSDDGCWSLFERRAFVDGDSDAHPDLARIGKEIVNKCNGLPLAVKTLGGLLRSKVDVPEWEAILKSEIWDLPEERNDILPALRLSYHHLPAHLKRCFAYCGCIIDKGGPWEYDVGHEIIRRWMAQGFIQPEGNEQMEDRGREYLFDLVSRSLLDCYDPDMYENSCYSMHDLTHDLARSVLGTHFWKIGDEKSHGNAEKARYMSDPIVLSWSRSQSCNFEDFYCLKSLRTLSLSYTGNIPADLFINLRHIRILHLHFDAYDITKLPESIGDLLQLRYLELYDMFIERLPKSTTRLYNLQTLILDYCDSLVELPSDLSNLVNLRHLSLDEVSISLPPRIGRLKDLQKLRYFNVGKEIGHGINELKDLIHLRGSLCISKLENVVKVEDAKEAQLKNKQKIDSLELRWKCDDVELRQEGIEQEVLDALQPHTNLKRLEIEGYCGVRFPTWLGDLSFSELTHVYLKKCRCRLLPPFGRLPSLKYVELAHFYELKKVGREFYGDGTVTGFPPLESLSFTSMPDLEELSGLESDIRPVHEILISNCTKLSLSSLRYLTSLSSLKISNCSNLTSLPNGLLHLTSLQSLKIADCPELTSLYDVDLPATLDDGLGNSNYSNQTCSPRGLKILRLENCPKIDLYNCTSSLRYLTSLSSLEISNCSNLTSLPNGLLHLTSLQSLKIADCPQLTSLYDVDLPATLDDGLGNSNYSNPTCLPKGLQNLSLYRCDKIHSLPEELLTTLRSLYIMGCSLLREKYLILPEGGNGYRCKISGIPHINFYSYYYKENNEETDYPRL